MVNEGYLCHYCGEWGMIPEEDKANEYVELGRFRVVPVGRCIYSLDGTLTCKYCGRSYSPSADKKAEREQALEELRIRRMREYYEHCKAEGFPRCHLCSGRTCLSPEGKPGWMEAEGTGADLKR
jgi:hypothetical protein